MKYRITKPKNTAEFPQWIPEMDRWNGKIIDATEITPSGANFDVVSLKWGCEWDFASSWLTPVKSGKIRLRE